MSPALPATFLSRFQSSADAAGTVAFDRYMELVLYDPEFGYYATRADRAGRDGDFVTSPELSPLFGACVAEWVQRLWTALGGPEFHLVEVGAGRGTLAATVLDACPASLREHLTLHLVERGQAPRRALSQRFAAKTPPARVHVYEGVDALPSRLGAGAFVANELFDNLPVRRVMKAQGWKEIRLRIERGTLRETLVAAPSDLVAALEEEGLRLSEGQAAEVRPGAVPLLESVLERFDRGGLLVFDYGGEAHEVSGDAAPHGTLAAYRGHFAHGDLYANPGQQDLTASVNFTPLLAAAKRRGFAALRLETQAKFLLAHGLAERIAGDAQHASPAADPIRASQRGKQLFHPEALGEAFRVLSATKAQ